MNKSYWEVLLIEWEELPQILQLKAIGRVTEMISQATN